MASFQRTMDILRSAESGAEVGTLYHLANITQNSNLKLDPLNDYQRVKNSFTTMLHAYVVTATLTHIGAMSI